MSHKLQLDADHTLEAAKKMVRQRKAVQEQQVQLRSEFQEEGLPVEAIGNTGAGVRSQKFNRRAKPFSKTTESVRPWLITRNKCMRCGKELHPRKKVEAIQKTILEQYPSLFTGLGTFKGEYKIKLKPNTEPFVLYTPRTVPFPQRESPERTG